MKPIEKIEMYQHVNRFLKTKGVEIKDPTYAKHLEKSCGLLTDAINLTQKGMERARRELDKRLDQVRQVIHEKTAPKPPFAAPVAATGPTVNQTTQSSNRTTQSRSRARSSAAGIRKKRAGKSSNRDQKRSGSQKRPRNAKRS